MAKAIFGTPSAMAILVLTSVATACLDRPESPQIVDVEHEQDVGKSWESFRRDAERNANGTTVYSLGGDEFTASEQYLRAVYDDIYSSSYESKLHIYKRISTGFEPAYPVPARYAIRYCVSDQFGAYPPSKATMLSAVQNALRAWERVANVRFKYESGADSNCTDQTSTVEFAVVPSTSPLYSGCAANKMMWIVGNGGPVCPVSGPFSNPAAVGVLAINLQSGLSSYLTLQGLATHELGHILGFRHEHPFGPNGCGQQGEAQQYPQFDTTFRGLTAYDQSSAMHYAGYCGRPGIDYAVSLLDGVGSRSVYGMPASWQVPIGL
jgi:serralysin